MSDDFIIQHCSPTLAGIKSGNLFSCEYEDKEELARDIRRLNRLLNPKGLRIIPMRYGRERVLLYMYRPHGLEKELAGEEALKILEQAGYESASPERCVITLINRLREGGQFPHEIGLFLSYPPEDVEGFIANHGKGAKLSGIWKVYGSEADAQRTFDSYRRCTKNFCARAEAGFSLEELTVADSAVRRQEHRVNEAV